MDVRLLTTAFLTLFVALSAHASEAASSAATPHVTVRLLSEHGAIAADHRHWLAVRLELIPGWHVYWRNPGDSGAAPTLEWTLPAGIQAGDIRWPTPKRIAVGPLTNYGYEGSVTLLVPFDAASIPPDGSPVRIAVLANWLVCQEECIPERATLAATLPLASGSPPLNPDAVALFAEARARLPLPLAHRLVYRRDGGTLHFELHEADWNGDRVKDLWFAANRWGTLQPSAPQPWRGEAGRLRWSAPLGEAPPQDNAPIPGLLVIGEELAEGAVRRGFAVEALPVTAAPRPTTPGVLGALGLAFLGGLILNLMPCVLPVLAIKAIGLTSAAQAGRSRMALHGVLYTAGVLLSFATMAATLLALRTGGESMGWGFQLQSPLIVTLLGYLMLLVALNFSGVFEVGGRLMGLGQAVTDRPGWFGALTSGVLAAVVASPCTAPFMGAALGYAITRPAVEAMTVFLTLGAGFALPLLLISLWPASTRRLPRPGPWMIRLRQWLALPMYGAAAWLLWVLSQQVGPEGLAAALAGLVIIGFAAQLYGQSHQQRGRSTLFASLFALAGLSLVPLVGGEEGPRRNASTAAAWSAERVQSERREGRAVFVNFTAAWCITCKVNERLALQTPTVAKALAEKGVTYLRGDWTRHDPQITRELQRHGRSGVPLYLLYLPEEPGPIILPQLLSEDIVLAAIDRI